MYAFGICVLAFLALVGGIHWWGALTTQEKKEMGMILLLLLLFGGIGLYLALR